MIFELPVCASILPSLFGTQGNSDMTVLQNVKELKKGILTFFLSKGRQVAIIRTFAILTYSLFLSTALWFGLFKGDWKLSFYGFICLSIYTIGLFMAERGEFRFSSILRVSMALFYFCIVWRAAGGLDSVAVVWASSLILGIMWASGYFYAAGLNLIASGLGLYDYTQGRSSAFNLAVYLVNNQLSFFIGVLFKSVSDHHQMKAVREKQLAEQQKQKAEVMNSLLTSVSESEKESASCFIAERGTLEYPSKYFRRLFGISSAEELIKKLSSVNSSEIADCLSTMLGSDELTWSINEGLLPKEALINDNHHILIWLPIYNQRNEMTKIYFEAINDEQLLQAQKKSARLSADADIVMHMIHLGSQKVCDFIDKSRALLKDSQNYLGMGENRVAYIALHTVKGAARTLNFNKLSEKLHEAETAVTEQGQPMVLIQECNALLDDLAVLAHMLEFSNESPSISLKSAEAALESGNERVFLMELVYRSLDVTLLSFDSQLEKIAKELHKETPFVDVSSPKVFLRRPTYEALDTALVHIFRNALDHGIESPEERLRKGKSPRGTIVIRCELTGEGVHISIRDDGQGLVLKDIREKALLKGLLKDSTAAPNELAECIFHGGFSTASSLTLTSGRGVGMDAVRSVIQNIGGTVHARVHSHQSPAPWTLEIFLPHTCIITAGDRSVQRQSA